MSYRIEVERRAQKELARLPRQVQIRVATAIDALAANPRPSGCKPIKGAEKGMYRVRVGNYRIVYLVLDDEQTVVVARVGIRSEHTYRGIG